MGRERSWAGNGDAENALRGEVVSNTLVTDTVPVPICARRHKQWREGARGGSRGGHVGDMRGGSRGE